MVNKLIDYFLVLLIIVTSGSCIGLEYASILTPLFFIVSLSVYIIRKGWQADSSNFLILLLLLIFYLLSATINTNPNYRMYINYILLILASYNCCCSLPIKVFIDSYVKILTLISLIGIFITLLCYVSNISSMATYMDKWYMLGPYNISSAYSMSSMNINRFSSIFWEPAANQFFISLAIVFHMMNTNSTVNKQNLITYLILIISLLLTRSLTAYICLVIILLSLIYFAYKTYRSPSALLLGMFSMVAYAAILILLINADVVTGKATITNESFNGRTSDFFQSIELIKENIPITGYGYGTLESAAITNQFYFPGINSVGLFSNVFAIGLLETIIFVLLIINKIYKNCKKYWILFMIVIFISFITENFFLYPIYFILIFKFRNAVNVDNPFVYCKRKGRSGVRTLDD